MTSPFPGMDLYVESPVQWPDFHTRFINTLSEVIADTLPDAYFARIGEDAVLLEPDPPGFKAVPDVLVGADAPARATPAPAAGATSLEPATLANVIPLDPHVEYFIEIVRLPAAEVVTVVEVLSPTNKQGGGRGVYTDKRTRLLRMEDVNLIEVDLLRAGRRVQLARPLPPGDYHALISRVASRPMCDVYSWTVRDPLPTIPVPLRGPTPDAAADLALAFRLAYDRGRYRRMIDYTQPPPPPVFDPDALAWVTATATRRG